MGASQAREQVHAIGLEPDPTQVKPDVTIGSWHIFHENWDKPIEINFYLEGNKTRFYLGSDRLNADKDMTGQLAVANEDLNHQILMTFDKDINTIHEFDWARSFGWKRNKEPRTRLKAMDEKTGFYLWKSKVEKRDESSAEKTRERQLNQQQFEAERKQDMAMNYNQDNSVEQQYELDPLNQKSMDAYEADLMKQIFEPPEPEIKPKRQRNAIQPSNKQKTGDKKDALAPLRSEYMNVTYQSRRFKTHEIDVVSQNPSSNETAFDKSIKSHGGDEIGNQSESYSNVQNSEQKEQPHQAFRDFQHAFENMIDSTFVTTEDLPVVSLIITNDNERVIISSKVSDHESVVKQYDLLKNKWVFRETYGGSQHNFIKLKDVSQNKDGNLFACPYNDDGVFKLRIFNKEQRPQSKAVKEEFNLNRELEINNYTMVNEDFFDPNITCCFISDQQLFVNLFHNHDMIHYHFVFDIEYRQVLNVIKFEMHEYCTPKNFPFQSFYDQRNEVVYSFYRQGQVFNIPMNTKEPEVFTFTKYAGSDLGQMTMYKDDVLICQNSSSILFFKKAEADSFSTHKEGEWYNYHTVNCRGFVSWVKGNDFVKVTSEDMIYYYDIDHETKEPKLQNVMKNYMKCTMLETSPDQQYLVAYRVNQEEFEVFHRKRNHQFSVRVDDRNYEHSQVLELETIGIIVVTCEDSLLIFDCETLAQIDEVKLPLMKSKTREPEEIIALQKSKDEQLLAIVTGKTLITQEQKQSMLFILQRQSDNTFAIKYQIPADKLKPFFNEVSINFFFKQNRTDIIIFCGEERIFMINFETQQMKTIHKFIKPLDKQPHTFICNSDQTIYLAATNNYCNYYNMNSGIELQLNGIFHASDFKDAIFDHEEKIFYLCCNRQHDRIGFYILKFSENDPSRYKNITQWRHKLEIGDVSMNINRCLDPTTNNFYKELVLGYKTIYHNVFTIHVQDLSGPDNQRNVLFRHESYHIWEQKCNGMLINRSQCYVYFSNKGIEMVYLGAQPTREIVDCLGDLWVVHSLDKFSFLKLDPINFISYDCEDKDNIVVHIKQEYVSNPTEQEDDQNSFNFQRLSMVETIFDQIYSLNIKIPTLSELLIIESFFESRTTAEILKLIRLQPNPGLFYKSYLELDGANLTSILASDSICTQILLSEDFDDFFSEKFPIIYKIVFTDPDGKTKYTSAIDIALKNDQIKAIGLLIDYIVKYQNNYVSSYLFMSNLGLLIGKGVNMYPLFTSMVFLREFDYDQWPGVHDDDTEEIRPYNESIFHLRDHYRTVFMEDKFKEVETESMSNIRIFKIKYTINLLPQFFFGLVDSGDDDGSLWDELKDSNHTVTGGVDEPGYWKIDYFTTEAIQQIIDFKWLDGAQGQIFFNFFIHCVYIFLIVDYVWCVYIRELYGLTEITSDYYQEVLRQEVLNYSMIMSVYLLYPLGYEGIQASLAGISDYLQDPYNYGDILNISCGILHIIITNTYGPHGTAGRLTLVIAILASSFKLFMLLRVFSSIAPVVAILRQSIFDLRYFLMILFLMVFILSMQIAVTGLSNKKAPGKFNEEFGKLTFDEALAAGMPAIEYGKIPGILKFFLEIFNVCVGNFALTSTNSYLDETMQTLFWLLFIIIVLILMVVFLNFVVAKAMASHSEATSHMEAVINKEKADMIDEVESLAWERYKNPLSNPRYLIKRTVEL